ncbi:MAG TPA: dephospho-CoA kinase [Candidatus Udaeobacter sp.]|nr:dephospho-CoA kinase [Candidatus Udaeobacter sp.]
MKVLGLTGSVGMGKSTAAAALRRMGIPVHDADREVHRLLGPGGGALAPVAAAFPGVIRNGSVDRQELGRRVFSDALGLARLEAILHPLVRAAEGRFLARCRRQRRRLAVLDIPLLLETGAAGRCDAVFVVSAPRRVQLARVLGRPGMTEARLRGVEARQMPDGEKRRLADVVIPTGLGRRFSLDRLRRAVRRLANGPADA